MIINNLRKIKVNVALLTRLGICSMGHPTNEMVVNEGAVGFYGKEGRWERGWGHGCEQGRDKEPELIQIRMFKRY